MSKALPDIPGVVRQTAGHCDFGRGGEWLCLLLWTSLGDGPGLMPAMLHHCLSFGGWDPRQGDQSWGWSLHGGCSRPPSSWLSGML